MKEKIPRILFCVVILTGTLLGSGVTGKEEKEILILSSLQVIYETGNDLATSEEAITKAENAVAEEFPESMNAFGMPLMEDTVLLVTVEKCRSNYKYISAEYEYDTTAKQQWYTSYDEEGHVERRHRTDYDDRENTLLYAEYDASGHCVKLWKIYCDDEEDEEGDLTADSGYVIWEKEYDDRGRLIKNTYCQDKEWYNYIYTVVGDSDGDYPYDRIKMSWF